MKKIFSFLVLLLACAGFKAQATHYLGGELAYRYVGPNTYQVKFTHYKNGITGAPPPTSHFDLVIKSPGCNTGRTIPLAILGYQPGMAYGPQPQYSDFSGGGSWGHTFQIYSATVTFSAAEQACTDWYLSVTTDVRPPVTNLSSNAFVQPIYTEAFLKLGTNLQNNSPEFDQLAPALPVVPPFQDAQVSMGALDYDGDSLVYSLVAPLKSHNQPMTVAVGGDYTFTPFRNQQNQFMVNPNPLAPYSNTSVPPNPQFGYFVASSHSYYSPTFPLASYHANWNDLDPATGIPNQFVPVQDYFEINSTDGTVRFNPAYYVPDTTIRPGKNTYVVSVQVDEYRKINGVAVKIGSVRRETIFGVGFTGTNLAPTLTNGRLNNQPFQVNSGTTGFTLRAGVPYNLQFTATDLNPNDVVTIASNADSLLPGATFSVSGGNLPTYTLNWIPTAGQVRQQPYFLRLLVKDNATPLRSFRVITIPLRVSNTGGVTGTKKEMAAANGFLAFPNPFSREVSFKIDAATAGQEIYVYNALGQLVDRFPVSKAGEGNQTIRWEKAGEFAAGTYIAKLITSDKTVQTLKFTKLP
jgi:hypothetical protein